MIALGSGVFSLYDPAPINWPGDEDARAGTTRLGTTSRQRGSEARGASHAVSEPLGHVGPDQSPGGCVGRRNLAELPGVLEDLPEEKAEAAQDLRSYRQFLADLEDAGHDYVVIGGCAVAAYARQLDIELFSADLDLYASEKALREILDWARSRDGLRIAKRPKPRAVPVAVLYWNELEVNVLTGSSGLPDVRLVADHAREVEIDELLVPVADPFDLLANKLAVKREKDLPHIEVLRRFVEAEIVTAFESETNRRRRLAPARRYLELLGLKRLPPELAGDLLTRSRYGSDLRFLASTAPTSMGSEILKAAAALDPALIAEIQSILELDCLGLD